MKNLFVSLRYSNEELTSIDATRPDGSIKGIRSVDAELWELAHQGLFGPIEPYIPPPEPSLEELIQNAIGLIDRKTGEFRRQFITDIPGQSMTYLRKQEVAKQFLSEPEPDPTQYPRIMVAVGVVADTPREVAEIWATKAAEWEQVDVIIEGRREAFKKQVSQASSEEELGTIIAEFKNWSI